MEDAGMVRTGISNEQTNVHPNVRSGWTTSLLPTGSRRSASKSRLKLSTIPSKGSFRAKIEVNVPSPCSVPSLDRTVDWTETTVSESKGAEEKGKKGKSGAYDMKRVAADAHLPTPQLF